jgi:NADPH-dependent curcumin reductase
LIVSHISEKAAVAPIESYFMRGIPMNLTKTINHRIVLNSRPIGPPTAENFKLEELPVPVPSAGQVLLRTLYLSLDPYMRGRMSDAPSYAPPVALGEVMVGGTVSRVEASQHQDFKPGDEVLGYSGWQEYALSDGTDLTRLDALIAHPSLALGVLGMPGFTAYMGLLNIGQPKPGETVVVAAASGAVGSVVGQIAKINGCHVVGIASGDNKCRYVVEELGFDACIDRRNFNFHEELMMACKKGIDVYFESVGGVVFDAVLPLLNIHSRIVVCGLIAHYNNGELTQGPDRLAMLMRTVLTKRIKIQGFIIFDDYGPHFNEFHQQMSKWMAEGKIKYREDIVDGLQNAPDAFIGLLKGKNFGKLIVRIVQNQT